MEVILLAGGMGTRLQSVVKDIPKCMAQVAGKPFLFYLFEYLIPFHPSKIILSLGYKHEIVEEWVSSLHLPVKIVSVIEPTPLGTGGAIKYACTESEEESVIVINGDTFFDVDLKKLSDFHKERNVDAAIALKSMKNFDRYGSVEIEKDSDKIIRFKEKEFIQEGLINGGTYIINKSSLDCFPEKFSLENDYFPLKVKEKKLIGLINNSSFIDIGIPEDYKKVQSFFDNK